MAKAAITEGRIMSEQTPNDKVQPAGRWPETRSPLPSPPHDPEARGGQGRKLPASVLVVIAVLILSVGLSVVGTVMAMGERHRSRGGLDFDPAPGRERIILEAISSLGVGLIFIFGMIVGNRLAWQWLRILALLNVAGLFAMAAIMMVAEMPLLLVGSALLGATCVLTNYIALGRQSARRHFRLQCPSCGSFAVKAANFFFTRVKCKDCQKVW
jgi:hypothetical protein